MFYKTPENQNATFKKNRDCQKIFLDDLVIIGRTREEITALQNIVIFYFIAWDLLWSRKSDDPDKGNDFFHLTEKIKATKTDIKTDMSGSNSFKVNKGIRSTNINSFSHFLSKTSLPFSPKSASSGTEEKWP